jgi:hypothetical protein
MDLPKGAESLFDLIAEIAESDRTLGFGLER